MDHRVLHYNDQFELSQTQRLNSAQSAAVLYNLEVITQCPHSLLSDNAALFSACVE